jgi:hypothetical protein
MNFKILALLALFVSSANGVKADVVITRLEPPFQVVMPWENLPDPLVEAIDFNHDGQVDLYFTYDNFGMAAGFFAPGQIFIVPTAPPAGHTNVYGFVAALPFGTIIGSNVVSSVNLGNDLWYSGDVVLPGEDTEYGDRGDDVGYVASDATVGDPIVVAGDVVGKEGVMALEFYINGQPHFGYVHFDFRYIVNPALQGGGFGGYIYGYAYETQPGVPITAERLNDSTPTSDGLITGFNQFSGLVLTWNAVNGGTYQVQSSTNLATWTNVGGGILANQNSVTFTMPAPSVSQCFYRIQRVN